MSKVITVFGFVRFLEINQWENASKVSFIAHFTTQIHKFYNKLNEHTNPLVSTI